ncbi:MULTISPECIES: BBE domain-containing protein [Halorussus]|uniref:BBE domain-containing protein n=1 Tax=Halorussus TaxID=1070314 RepID=UPI000E212862|nr:MULTISPECIES: BBE domain-containing protein [Halorussus]NHN57712.1 hypothetical protein [Halorussus sp. JP-T4]
MRFPTGRSRKCSEAGVSRRQTGLPSDRSATALHDRLAEVKAAYDPEDVFRDHQNVTPGE